MKSITQYLIAGLLMTLGSCQKANDPAPTNCRVTSMAITNTGSNVNLGNVQTTFTYDGKGRVAQAIIAQDSAGKKRPDYLFTFNYDGTGALTQTSWTRNGQPNGSETYSYAGTNGALNRITFNYTNGLKGVNNITRNNVGLITVFTLESSTPELDQYQYFEYNADSQLIKHTVTDGKGKNLYEVRYTLVGKIPTPETLLVNAGLPYNLITNGPWVLFSGGEGSSRQIYTADKTGQLVLLQTEKLTVTQTNGYGVSRLWTNTATATPGTTTVAYSLAGCN